MGQFAALKIDGQMNQTIQNLLASLLEKQIVKAVLVPARQAHPGVVMQTLFTSPKHLGEIDPFAPVVAKNAATMVASLTHGANGEKVAVVLRSCEVRAFLELVKLHQGKAEGLLIIGIDCLGRYENRDFLALAEKQPQVTESFLKESLKNMGEEAPLGIALSPACKICVNPVAENVDLRLGVLGAKLPQELLLEGVSEQGQTVLKLLELEIRETAPQERLDAIEALEKKRAAAKETILGHFIERSGSMDKLSHLLAPCVNCYNCRVACPVCYCRECVYVTDTFRYTSEQYFKWSQKKGKLKLPTDTLFYHLTRMVHMSTLCVGCGQCSSACPNDIPLVELFQTVAQKTQARFDYSPGRKLEEEQPLAVFYAEEFNDVTGQVK